MYIHTIPTTHPCHYATVWVPRLVVLAFTFKLGQKQARLRGAMETVKICSKCVGRTINAGSGFHCSSVLRLFILFLCQVLCGRCCVRFPRTLYFSYFSGCRDWQPPVFWVQNRQFDFFFTIFSQFFTRPETCHASLIKPYHSKKNSKTSHCEP